MSRTGRATSSAASAAAGSLSNEGSLATGVVSQVAAVTGGVGGSAAGDGPVSIYECPITGELMRDPVITCDGHAYERSAIEQWFHQGRRTSPLTNCELRDLSLVPHVALKGEIQSYLLSSGQELSDKRLSQSQGPLAQGDPEAERLRRQLAEQESLVERLYPKPSHRLHAALRRAMDRQDTVSGEILLEELRLAKQEYACLAEVISLVQTLCGLPHTTDLDAETKNGKPLVSEPHTHRETENAQAKAMQETVLISENALRARKEEEQQKRQADAMREAALNAENELRARQQEEERCKRQAEAMQEAALVSLGSIVEGSLSVDARSLEALREAESSITEAVKTARELRISEAKLVNAEKRRRKVHNMIEDLKGSIRVFCRVRPLNSNETRRGDVSVAVGLDSMTLEIDRSKGGALDARWDTSAQFVFDAVFMPGTQGEVFEECRDLVQSVIDGYNATVFAYGQTGAGKTYTIFGTSSEPGLGPQLIEELYRLIDRDAARYEHTVRASMLELYKNDLVDLLHKNQQYHSLQQQGSGSASASAAASAAAAAAVSEFSKRMTIRTARDGEVNVENATEEICTNAASLQEVLDRGSATRSVSSHAMNSESSRSHLIMTVKVTGVNKETGSELRGKLMLVDLAGSERLKKSLVVGDNQKETIEINKSLTALGDVIESLTQGQKQIPYRNHKLTMVMQDSLGQTAKTLMFVNCSPASSNLDETLMSLKYATRAKKITNMITPRRSFR